MTKQEREKKEACLSGVLIALGCVYVHDAEGVAEEIVGTVGAAALLRVAKKEQDCYLPNLRKTVNFLKSRAK